jgi:type IV pilus assembly protein PilE
MNKKPAGFTLIELMVAVAIAALLSVIGFKSYTSYVMRANRAVARATLMGLAAKEEVVALQNPTAGYATDFSKLNGLAAGTTSFYVDSNGAVSTSSSVSSIYQISFSATSTSAAFSLVAQAQGVQARRDTTCTTLTVGSTGLKQAQNSSGTAVADPTTCWDK